jgi:protein-tyrosine-phosphatase
MPDRVNKPLITIICTANICRSPMAERLLAHALEAESPPLSCASVVSAGVAASNGEPPSGNSVKALKAVGLDLSDHRSQELTDELLAKSSVVFCMTSQHREAIRTFYDPGQAPILLFREPYSDTDCEIPDPFGQDLAAYTEARDSMVEAIPAIIDWLRKNLPAGD